MPRARTRAGCPALCKALSQRRPHLRLPPRLRLRHRVLLLALQILLPPLLFLLLTLVVLLLPLHLLLLALLVLLLALHDLLLLLLLLLLL